MNETTADRAATLLTAKAAIVTVGAGRGFVVEGLHNKARLVVTAAHCLPHLPPAHPFSFSEERTYGALVGPRESEPTVMAECLFVDPIADVAVLGEPDNQSVPEEWDAYLAFVESVSALRVGVVSAPGEAWLLTLNGEWKSCAVRVSSEYTPARALTLVSAAAGNVPGTSGSPIIGADGRAIGVVSVGSQSGGVIDLEQSGQPLLASTLPLWLLSELRVDVVKARAGCRGYIHAIRHAMQQGVP